ncbi:MAG: phosphate ABC transporter substrate-binding protein PstS, partial [Nocardioides sp.]
MKSTSIGRRIVPAVAALALGLSVAACGAGNESSGGSGDGGGDAVTLNGGGATSQAKAEGVWRDAYQSDSGNTVNYEEVGSGTGRENFNSGAYSFAGTDSYINDDEGELSAAKERCNGEDPIEVPAYVSPIAVAFNLGGDITSLNLSSETIANIFNGTITKWDDDAIAADNPDATLPDTAIAIIHRSDDSGTTANFTDYLSKTSNGAWAADPDDTWPADLKGGQGL